MTATPISCLDAAALVGCLITPADWSPGEPEYSYQCTGLEVAERNGRRQVHIRLQEFDTDSNTLIGEPLVLPSLDGYRVAQPLRNLPVAEPTWEDARALIGQRVSNPYGLSFICTGMTLFADSGEIFVEIDDFDENGQAIGAECGHLDVSGFTWHGPLRADH